MELGVLYLALGLGAAALGRHAYRRRRGEISVGVRSVERVTIADAERGRFVGEVRALDDTVRASLSGRECVYYSVVVEEEVPAGRSSVWTKVASDCEHVPFLLDDGTGAAIVHLCGAVVALERDRVGQTGLTGAIMHALDSTSPTHAAQLAVMAKCGVTKVATRALRFREAIIAVGGTIVVVGAGVRQPIDRAGGDAYREPAATRLTLAATSGAKLYVSDYAAAIARR